MIKSLGVLFVVQILFGSVASGKDFQAIEEVQTYILAKKGRHLPIGTVLESTSHMSMKDGVVEIKVGDEVVDGAMKTSSDEVEKLEMLEEGRQRYTLTKSESKEKMVVGENDAPMPDESKAIVGKPIILSLNDEKWTAELEKGEPTAKEKEEIEELLEEFNNDADLSAYGSEPRKVGDEWEAEGADVFKVEGMEGKMKFKFARVERYRGIECAVLTCSFKVIGQEDELPGVEMTMKGKATIYRSLRDLQDVHAELDGEMGMDGMMSPQPGMEMEMKINGKLKIIYGTKVNRPKR